MTMPALGESVTEGTVTRWLKQVGDQVEADEPLLEVSTDKVDTEIPAPVAGTLLEILVGGGRDRRGRRQARRHRCGGRPIGRPAQPDDPRTGPRPAGADADEQPAEQPAEAARRGAAGRSPRPQAPAQQEPADREPAAERASTTGKPSAFGRLRPRAPRAAPRT